MASRQMLGLVLVVAALSPLGSWGRDVSTTEAKGAKTAAPAPSPPPGGLQTRHVDWSHTPFDTIQVHPTHRFSMRCAPLIKTRGIPTLTLPGCALRTTP